MKIKKVVCAPGKTGFFFDDQKAIKSGAKNDGAFYEGKPVTPGFTAVRQAGESICVMFLLENGAIAYGDCAAMDRDGIDAEIVADEWCNTLEDIKDFTEKKAGHMAQIKTPDLGGINNAIEAVIYCKKNNMGAYLGGTCNETNRSAEICAHIAMATSPVQYLAKPGMGVDEGYMIVYNEMSRILALTK